MIVYRFGKMAIRSLRFKLMFCINLNLDLNFLKFYPTKTFTFSIFASRQAFGILI